MNHHRRTPLFLGLLLLLSVLISFNLIGCGSGGSGGGGNSGSSSSGSSGGPAVAGHYAYVCNYGDGTVGQINTTDYSYKEISNRAITVGSGPYGAAIRKDNSIVLVTNQAAGTVSLINVLNQVAIANYGGFYTPSGVKFSGALAIVANQGNGTVYFYDSVNANFPRLSKVGGSPVDVVISPDGATAYASNVADRSVSVIDVNQVGTELPVTAIVPDVGDAGIDVDVNSAYIFVADSTLNQVSRINAVNLADITKINVGVNPQGVACSPVNSALTFVANAGSNSISVINGSTWQQDIPVESAPRFVAFNPTGTLAYVTNSGSNSVCIIDVASYTVIKTVAVGNTPLGITVAP